MDSEADPPLVDSAVFELSLFLALCTDTVY